VTPFPTKAETKASQEKCKEAWELSHLAIGHEKMKLIALAHPHSLDRSAAEGPLIFYWHPRLEAFTVGDFGGFITMIPEADTHVLIDAIKMEFHQAGAFRELITGKKAPPVKKREITKYVKPPSLKISLEDLGI